MAADKPWKSAMWTPVPGCRPTDVKRASFKTAGDAHAWVRRLRLAGKSVGRRIVIWHVTQLPPAEIEETAPAARPDLRVVRGKKAS